jgi:hypothetical protein
MSKPVAALLVDLEISKTHSRPHVSDDNPYSERQFKTLKYRARLCRDRCQSPIAVVQGKDTELVLPEALSLCMQF